MTDIGATWHSPTETPLADDTILPSPEHQSKVKIDGRGTPPADSTTSPAMADAEDTQPGSTEAPLMNKDTVPLAEFNAEAKQGLPATEAASPAESENPVALSAELADTPAGPLPHLAIQQKRNKVCQLWQPPWGPWVWRPPQWQLAVRELLWKN